jgi:D-lactate dehydrogenase
MRVAVFSAKKYEREFLNGANSAFGHELVYFDTMLEPKTAFLAAGFAVVCVFVNDLANAQTIGILADGGTRLIATRSTGFNHIDLGAARDRGIAVVRVVEYSPYSVAEFTVGLLLALNRKIHRAYNRTRDGNFELEGLLGFDFHGRCVGLICTGKIGRVFAGIMRGFGCEILGYDKFPNPEFTAAGGTYASLDAICERADVVSLHCPLTPETHHIINALTLSAMKPGALLANTSRGGLIDTEAAIDALKSGRLGGLAIDVYEQETELFFQDLSSEVIVDDVIQRLVSFPNVIVTGHQAFFTREALGTIVATTLESITDFEANRPLRNQVGSS